MKRREFITLVGGAAAAWPVVARAQQPERVRRIGVLMASPADDSENQARMAAFLEGLAQLGWTDGRNVRIDTRWATTNADDLRRHAAELAALVPDVLVAASGTATVAPLLQRPAPCRSCSWLSSTRSAPVSSRAWGGRAATRLGSRCSNTA
jgi:putative tryptophan/tyrosine transport system substrate-binding protein